MWQQVYNSISDQGLKTFMRKIPPQNLANMGQNEALNYVRSAYARSNISTPRDQNILAKEPSESIFKLNFSNNSESEDLESVANKLISGYKVPEGRASGLQLKAASQSLRALEALPKSLGFGMSQSSVSLVHKTVLLDSRNKNTSQPLSWNLVPFSSQQQGQIYVQSDVQQIVRVRCGAFKFPVPKTLIDGNLQNVFWNRSIRIGIQEFNNQGIELVGGDRYNFSCATQTLPDGNLFCTPAADWIPTKLISQISKLTVNFYGDTEQIILDQDRFLCATAAGNPTVFTASTPHLLATGDIVYPESGELKNAQGYTIAVLSPTTFEIAKLSSAPDQVFVYAASKRVQLELEFICLE